MNTFGEQSGIFAYVFDLVLALAGLCMLYMLFANLDMPLIRKFYKKPQFSLQTMFFLTAVASVDGVVLNWLDICDYRFVDMLVSIVCVTGGSYVLLSLAMMALQDMLALDPKAENRNRKLPKSISVESIVPETKTVVESSDDDQ